jgi:hypothetical protein
MLGQFIMLVILFTALPAMAGDSLIINPDPLRSDRYLVTDSIGSKIGSLKPDPLQNNRIQIIDRSGSATGYIKPSILPTSDKRYDTFTPLGDHAGSIRQDSLQGLIDISILYQCICHVCLKVMINDLQDAWTLLEMREAENVQGSLCAYRALFETGKPDRIRKAAA